MGKKAKKALKKSKKKKSSSGSSDSDDSNVSNGGAADFLLDVGYGRSDGREDRQDPNVKMHRRLGGMATAFVAREDDEEIAKQRAKEKREERIKASGALGGEDITHDWICQKRLASKGGEACGVRNFA